MCCRADHWSLEEVKRPMFIRIGSTTDLMIYAWIWSSVRFHFSAVRVSPEVAAEAGVAGPGVAESPVELPAVDEVAAVSDGHLILPWTYPHTPKALRLYCMDKAHAA